MIRQAISCDICGSEKKHTNHWYIAFERNGELRLAGWEGGKTRCSKLKHLCGQKCVHRLLDEFMAGHTSSAGHTISTSADANIVDGPTSYPGELLSLAEDGLMVSSMKSQSPAESGSGLSTQARANESMQLAETTPHAEPQMADRHSFSKPRASAWERERALLSRIADRVPRDQALARLFNH